MATACNVPEFTLLSTTATFGCSLPHCVRPINVSFRLTLARFSDDCNNLVVPERNRLQMQRLHTDYAKFTTKPDGLLARHLWCAPISVSDAKRICQCIC